MRRIIFFILAFLLVFQMIIPVVLAQKNITIPFGPDVEGVQHLPKVTATIDDPESAGVSVGVAGFRKILREVFSIISLVLGVLAVLMLFVAGYELITAQSAAAEEIQKQKMNVIYIILGLVVVGLASDGVYKYIFANEGAFLLEPETVQTQALLITNRIRELLTLFLSFSGSLAILALVTASIRLIVNTGEEGQIEKQKKLVGYTAVGIVIIGLADTLVTQIIFPDAGYRPPNVRAFEVQLQGLSNYILGFLGVIVFVSFVISGVMMVVNFGNDEVLGKIKMTLKNVVIGSIVIFSAYTVVATLLRTFMVI